MGRFDLTLFLITLFAITLTKAAEAKNVKEVAIEVDGEERKVEWDYTYEDVDAVARTYVRQNSLITQRDETGEEAASAISEALRSQINLEQQPVALAPVLRLASLERPGPSQLQRAETVISLYPGETKRGAKRRASNAISSNKYRVPSYIHTRCASFVNTAIILIPYPNPFRDSLHSSQDMMLVSLLLWVV